MRFFPAELDLYPRGVSFLLKLSPIGILGMIGTIAMIVIGLIKMSNDENAPMYFGVIFIAFAALWFLWLIGVQVVLLIHALISLDIKYFILILIFGVFVWSAYLKKIRRTSPSG